MTKAEIDNIIASNVYTNDAGLITGLVLQQVLLSMTNFTDEQVAAALVQLHSHSNKQYLDLIQEKDINVLSKLSIVNGNLQIDANAYSTGELSAYGIGSGGSSGGGVDLLQAWTDYDSAKDNWAVKAGLLVPFYNDTKSRLTSLEGGAALSLSTVGTGNGIANITKSGTVLTVTKSNFAELDVNGKILSSQLPSYVDDVLEYVNMAAFPATGETGKIYIAQDSNKTYRWSGTAYVEISASLALGETSSTAYRGDRGKIAYDHSQTEHQAIINGTGFVKANGKTLSYDNNSYSLASHNHSGVYEPVLGNPSANGYLLSSTNAGVRSWVAPYSLPTASASVLGGVKIGANVSIASGVISVHNPVTIGTANGLSLSTQELSLALATTAASGALSSTDKTYIELLKTFFEYDSTNNAIKALKSLYSTGEVSAYGIGSGGSGGSYERLDAWVDYDSTKSGWVLSALLGNDLNTRVGNLESGSALTFNTTGTGNAVTSISKAGTVITANKDLTFSLDGHIHNLLRVADTRDVVSIPQDLVNCSLQVDFKSAASVNNPPTSANVLYSHIISFAGWNTGEPSGGWPSQMSIGDGIAVRQAVNATTWGTWRNVYHTGNLLPVTTSANGLMSSTDKSKLDGIAAGAKTGTVTSVAMTVPTGLSISGSPITTSGTLAVSLASGYSIPTTAKQTQWDTAYTHSQASHDYLPLSGGTLTGNLTAPTFIGSLSGNASSATKLQTARTIAGVSFDGTANIAIPFANLSSKPTTLAGYGITNAYTKTEVDTALALKLNKSVFDDLFEKVEVSTGVFAIKAKYSFYSTGEVSAYGPGTGGGSGGGSLSGLSDVMLTSLAANNLLQFNGTHWVNVPASSVGTPVSWGTTSNNTSPLTVSGITKTVSLSGHLHTGVYEPVFTKNTAFNKNFGTTSDTVAQGNDSRIINGQTAFGWGNHSDQNYFKSTFLRAYVVDAEGYDANEANLTGGFVGSYYSPNWLTNRAFDGYGGLITWKGTSSVGLKLQMQYDAGHSNPSGGRLAFRTSYSSSGEIFTNWKEIWHTGNLTSLSQLTDNIGVATHIANTSNPHSVTKAQVGLGNVDNTPDLLKPISNAMQNALDTKFDKTGGRLTTGTGDVNIELWRGTNASWNILNSGGYLKFQSNYTTVAGAYFDTLKLDYNTGNALFKGNVTAPTFIGALTGNATTATTATKLGTATVGSTQLPFYLNAGTATAITQANLRIGLFGTTAIGSTQLPIYLAANGVPTAITQANLRIGLFGATAIGSATAPVYIAANGVATACTSFGGVTGIGTASPLMDGTVAVGTSTLAARQDHRHPVDTSRAAVGQTMYIGTTAVTINRASATLNLTGIGTLAMAGALSGATTIAASISVTTPKVIFAAAGWSVEQSGTEVQFKYNGVIKQRLLNDGSIVGIGEITAFGATS